MSNDQAVDFNHVPARHDTINLRLEHWAMWVRDKPQAWVMQPMFRQYRAPRQYEVTEVKIELNTLECHEVERCVSFLPDKHRTAIRWAYVFSRVPDARVRAELGATRLYLKQLIDEGRTMLINRMKQRMIDVG